ncbi:hypothetical protein ACE6H2_008022 [Prunus campanulata]
MSISRVTVSVSSGGSLLVSSKGSTSNNPEWNVKDLHSLYLDLLDAFSQEPESRRSLLVSSKGSTSNNPEWNVKDLHSLCLDLLGTLSQEPESRRQAETSLSEASQYPNYTLVLFSIVP